jgi:hypothetical protein
MEGKKREDATVTAGRASNASVDTVNDVALKAWEEERSWGPLFLCDGVKVGGRGSGEVDGAKGAGSFNELYELVVTSLQPLEAVRTSEGRLKGEGRAGRVKVEDWGRRGGGRGGRSGAGEPSGGEG